MRQPVPFGKYLLLDRISVGGMAEVFKAKSYGVEGFEKIIAIKRILPTMGEDRDFIKMFIDEAKIAGQLAHANICQIFELGRIDGSHFIAMEYIWGKDLLQIQNRLRKTKQMMPVPMACFVLAKVLEGLDYAHRKRDPLGRPLEIVHRDCSPQNVLVSYEGEVKIIDFGIAKATSRNSRTMAGVLKGKFGYMSPEQVRGLPLDRRSDVFALGTMLYECLTGDRLFHGETDFSTLEKVRNVDIRRPRELNPNIPEAVERIILRALAKDVDERYQWCSEMLADVQQYLMSQDVVFTAKSLSTWLKEVFAAEIERERQLLEQYKRVGRDGVVPGQVASVRQAVVESFGETPAPEGDPTMLGTPDFDDVERGPQGAGPAPGSPAALGVNGAHAADEDEEFQEEAPTEIYGEIEHPLRPGGAAAGRQSGSHAAARPTKPPPRPSAVIQSPPGQPSHVAASRASQPELAPLDLVPAAESPPAQAPLGGGQPGPGAHKTLLGQPAPSIPNQPQLAMPSPQPAVPPPPAGMPAPPLQGASHAYPPPVYPPASPGRPAAMPITGRESALQPTATPAPVTSSGIHAPVATIQPELGRRPSLARDIAIGVGIAAGAILVFLIVKRLVVDNDQAAPGTTSIATISMKLPRNVSAQLHIDGKLVRNVIDGTEIPVNAGERRIRLVGTDGAECEQAVRLPPGKTININCPLQPKPASEPPAPPAPVPPPVPPVPAQVPADSAAAPQGVSSDVVPKDAGVTRPKPPKAEDVASTSPQASWDSIDAVDKQGYLQIYSKPSARIFIDDKDTQLSTPITGKKLAVDPGTRRVQFVIGKDKFTFKVDVKAGEIATLNKDLQ